MYIQYKMGFDANSVVEVCLGLHSRRAARRISRAFDNALKPLGLDTSQFNLICVIAALDSAPLPSVAQVLDIDTSTLSRTLKPLRQQGFVQHRGGRGRGGLVLSLSERGSELLIAALPRWKGVQSQLTAVMGEAYLGRVLEALENVALVNKLGKSEA